MSPRARLLLAAGVCVGVVLFAVFRPVSVAYPTDDAGWQQRYEQALAGIGVDPGTGWTRWTDSAARAADLTAAEPALTPEELRAGLAAIDWPERVTPPTTHAAPNRAPDWSRVFGAIAGGIDEAAATGEADAAVAWAELAHRIELGVGVHAGYAGTVERCRVGSITDRAVRSAVSAGLFSSGLGPPDAVENRLGDLIGLCIEGGPFGIELTTRLERERALRRAVESGASPSDRRRIERLFEDLEGSHRGRAASADRARAFLDELAQGRHPGVASLLPDVTAATDARRAARAERAGLQMMLALERHRLRRGAYPDTLDALVPDQFIRLPVDPFGFGEGFGYRVLEPAAPTPAGGYLLWSVGPDRTPDEGSPLGADGRGDLVFHPPPAKEPSP